MKRRLFNILAALSLVMCVAIVGMWLRSRAIMDQCYVVMPERVSYLYSYRNRLSFWTVCHHHGEFDFSWRFEPSGFDIYEEMALNSPLGAVRVSFAGFGYMSAPVIGPEPGYTKFYLLRFPYWFVVGVSALLPGAWLRSWQRRRNGLRSKLCLACGYDLRATPDRCPECGTAVPKGRTPDVGR